MYSRKQSFAIAPIRDFMKDMPEALKLKIFSPALHGI